MLNTIAIQEAIDELRANMQRDAEAVHVLERLVGVGGPAPKNGGGKREKPRVTMSSAQATGPVVPGKRGGVWPRQEECDACGKTWTRKGTRSKCPNCN